MFVVCFSFFLTSSSGREREEARSLDPWGMSRVIRGINSGAGCVLHGRARVRGQLGGGNPISPIKCKVHEGYGLEILVSSISLVSRTVLDTQKLLKSIC